MALAKIEARKPGEALPFYIRQKYLSEYERAEIAAELELEEAEGAAEAAEIIKRLAHIEGLPPAWIATIVGRYCASGAYGSGQTPVEVLRDCRRYPATKTPEGYGYMCSHFKAMLRRMVRIDRGLNNGKAASYEEEE